MIRIHILYISHISLERLSKLNQKDLTGQITTIPKPE